MSVKKRRMIKRTAGLLIGAIGGFSYYAIIGCQSGSCPITSNPWISTGWGALIGITAAY
ncbi:MAG: YtxH domain-containing protein [Deltaproteobacteria bacterium]|nr:YtxH domain-containing protein [Deltaproteobacteria bacterium]